MCSFNPKNGGRFMDPCMEQKVKDLNEAGIKTVACCCGHGEYPETIVVELADGQFQEINSCEFIPRKRRFYRKDAEGVYYIPEAIP
jgi:hypothetical protein